MNIRGVSINIRGVIMNIRVVNMNITGIIYMRRFICELDLLDELL